MCREFNSYDILDFMVPNVYEDETKLPPICIFKGKRLSKGVPRGRMEEWNLLNI